MASQLFLRLDTIPGPSTIAAFPGQIELTSFHLAGENPIAPASTGSGAGKVTFAPITLTKPVDSSSIPLFLALCTGNHLATATLSLAETSSPTPHVTLKIDLTGVSITAISSSSDLAAPPTETISLAFKSIAFTYTSQLPTGAAAPAVTGGWDVTSNKKL